MELSCGITCVILRLAVLIQYRSVTDTQTDGHTTTAYTALSIASRGKKLAEIGIVVAKIFGGICRFLPSCPKRCSCYRRNLWGYWTGPILIIFAHDVATVLPLNIFESHYHITNRSGMPACRMKVSLPILSKIGCHGNVIWEIWKKRGSDPLISGERLRKSVW